MQLLTIAGELVVVAACVLGFVTAGSWLIAGADLRSGSAQPPPPASREVWYQEYPRERQVCWWDRRYGGEICEPPYRLRR